MKELCKKLLYSFHVMSHPFDGYWDLRNEKKGSVGAATVILVLAILTNIISRQFTGYIFNDNILADLNIFSEIIGFVLPFMLWCIANWCLTTLFDGEGTLKDIFIYTAYALVPYIIITLPIVLISRGITMDEAVLVYTIQKFAVIWAAFLIFIGTLTTHQFTVGKTVLTIFFTILGMAIILFLGMIFFILTQQIINFVLSLIKEISLRIA